MTEKTYTFKAVDKTGEDGGAPMLLWEQDATHPKGEVYIAADGREYEAGKTAKVMELVRAGDLEEVKAGKAKADPPPAQ